MLVQSGIPPGPAQIRARPHEEACLLPPVNLGEAAPRVMKQGQVRLFTRAGRGGDGNDAQVPAWPAAGLLREGGKITQRRSRIVAW